MLSARPRVFYYAFKRRSLLRFSAYVSRYACTRLRVPSKPAFSIPPRLLIFIPLNNVPSIRSAFFALSLAFSIPLAPLSRIVPKRNSIENCRLYSTRGMLEDSRTRNYFLRLNWSTFTKGEHGIIIIMVIIGAPYSKRIIEILRILRVAIERLSDVKEEGSAKG